MELKMILHSFISYRLDYCNVFFTCLNQSSLNRLQSTAARLLRGINQKSLITPVLSSLHWLLINFCVHFKILVLTFEALRGQSSQSISDLLHPCAPNRALRSGQQKLLAIPHSKYKTYGDCAFQALAPKLWNALSLQLRLVDSYEAFMKQLKKSQLR